MIIKARVISMNREDGGLGKRSVTIATDINSKEEKYSSFTFYSEDFQLDDCVDVEINLMQQPHTFYCDNPGCLGKHTDESKLCNSLCRKLPDKREQ